MEDLNLSNIMTPDEVDNLFEENDEETQETPLENGDDSKEKSEESKEEIKETTEVDPNSLFEEPESVGSEKEENKTVKEDTESNEELGTSQKHVFSSIAKALSEDGVFPDLDEQTINNIKTAQDFKDLMNNQIQAGLDERQKRIDKALNAGLEGNEIKRYEATLNYLDNISEDAINEESENGETLRKNLIYQDFINMGYSKERASREVKKSLDAGTDIEDALEALASNKKFFKDSYDNVIKTNEEEQHKYEEKREAQAKALQKSILEDEKIFGDLQVDKNTRKKIYDSISKPIYKDPDTGELYTAVQKYVKDNKTDFLKNFGLVYTLTNGFKNLDGLIKGKVNKEVNKGLKHLEQTINNTSRNPDGSIKFVSSREDDPESYLGFKLDL